MLYRNARFLPLVTLAVATALLVPESSKAEGNGQAAGGGFGMYFWARFQMANCCMPCSQPAQMRNFSFPAPMLNPNFAYMQGGFFPGPMQMAMVAQNALLASALRQQQLVNAAQALQQQNAVLVAMQRPVQIPVQQPPKAAAIPKPRKQPVKAAPVALQPGNAEVRNLRRQQDELLRLLEKQNGQLTPEQLKVLRERANNNQARDNEGGGIVFIQPK